MIEVRRLLNRFVKYWNFTWFSGVEILWKCTISTGFWEKLCVSAKLPIQIIQMKLFSKIKVRLRYFCVMNHCTKRVRIQSFSGPYFLVFGPEKLQIRTLLLYYYFSSRSRCYFSNIKRWYFMRNNSEKWLSMDVWLRMTVSLSSLFKNIRGSAIMLILQGEIKKQRNL